MTKTSPSRAFSSDLLHDVRCHRNGCNTVFRCSCGKMRHHEISTDLNYCGLHRRQPDPQRDPDDLVDLGGYRHRYYRS